MHDCCGTASDAPKVRCPRCEALGLPVGDATLSAMVDATSANRLRQGARFCRTRECPVVYFSASGEYVGAEAARVRIGLKVCTDPIPLCYCFGFTRAHVREQVALTGTSSIPARITAEVKTGRCECVTRNPSGACCLGEVTKAVRSAQEELRVTKRAVGG